MPNPFGKTRPVDQPYAIYTNPQGWTWHVCKTYKTPASEAKDSYARWFVWASSPMTHGEFEGGDTYRIEILRGGRLVAAEPEWIKQQGYAGLTRKYPTPAEYLATV